MALQNIGAANSDDAFYRYKMPRMITKIEGRGNGIKTNVVNMVDIAKALARPASYTTKYFGCELGAQSKYDEKTGTSHVNGAHDTAKLAGLLEKFIKMYVQCYGCGNPETEVVITKTQMITLKCAACGFLSDVDMRDKLTTFILKNPPEQKKSSKDKKAMRRAEKERLKEGEAADAEIKKVKKESVKKKVGSKDLSSKAASTKKKSSGSDEDHSPPSSQVDENEVDTGADDDDDGDDDVQWQTDTSAEAARQRMQEQLSSATAEMVMLTTEEPKPKPTKKSSESQNGTKSSDARKMLVNEIKEFLKKGYSPSQLKSFLDSRSESSQDIMNALFESLFEGVGKGFAKEVMRKKKYLLAAIAASTQEKAVSQTVLLCAMEHYGKSSLEAVKEVALILKSLYDDDVLEEKVIMKWYNEGLVGESKSSPIWKNAKPFIEWLQSAESESEDE